MCNISRIIIRFLYYSVGVLIYLADKRKSCQLYSGYSCSKYDAICGMNKTAAALKAWNGYGDGPGGVLGKILMGVCRWDSETLNLYQTTFMSFLQPYSRLDAKNPYPIPD